MENEEDIYEEYRRRNAERLEKNRNKQASAKEIVEQWSTENNVNLRILAAWQFRLTKDKFVVDIYPTKQRYHIISENKRGGYSKLEDALKKLFKDKL